MMIVALFMIVGASGFLVSAGGLSSVGFIRISAVAVLVAAFMLGAASAIIYTDGYDYAYRQGQIDAINGKIKYERVEHPDKTVTWELIEGGEDEI